MRPVSPKRSLNLQELLIHAAFLAEGERKVTIAEFEARTQVKAAEGNAQSKKLNAEADAAVIKTVGEAEAARAKILSVGGRKRT
jgi:regulator of protease activity HflC (stomatin/prohibitin superfamily)